jgi:ribokinase
MVVVFGSINLDLVTRVARFPAPGETLAALSFATHPGGKGANQALAAARAGARARLFGAVGSDTFAAAALELLHAGAVELGGVARVSGATGCATILVDAEGENCIAIAAGANAQVDPGAVPDAALSAATTLVLQNEVPEPANAALIARARRLGARIVLNAAPARPLPIDLLSQLDILVVNEHEAAVLAAQHGWPTDAAAFARALSAISPRLAVAVTLGRRGALLRSEAATLSAAPPRVDVRDTTGAGDAFVGALAAALDRGATLRDALCCGVAAGTLACTIHGAQASLPRRAEIEAALRLVTVAPLREC